jgi:hypothetical protein
VTSDLIVSPSTSRGAPDVGVLTPAANAAADRTPTNTRIF